MNYFEMITNIAHVNVKTTHYLKNLHILTQNYLPYNLLK
jgi:hypothetical protein